eukprot:scpid31365/ scgid20659/ 
MQASCNSARSLSSAEPSESIISLMKPADDNDPPSLATTFDMAGRFLSASCKSTLLFSKHTLCVALDLAAERYLTLRERTNFLSIATTENQNVIQGQARRHLVTHHIHV